MTIASVQVLIEERKLGIVARVTIENAAKLNTLGSALMIEFVGSIEALAASEDLRAVVLTGAGEKAFIGGANIFEMASLDAELALFDEHLDGGYGHGLPFCRERRTGVSG